MSWRSPRWRGGAICKQRFDLADLRAAHGAAIALHQRLDVALQLRLRQRGAVAGDGARHRRKSRPQILQFGFKYGARGDFRATWPLVLAACTGAVAGAPLGARLAVHVRGAVILRILATALVFVGLRLLFSR